MPPLNPRKAPATVALLPTLLTLANGVCGFGSLTLAAHEIDPSKADQRVFLAGLLVFVAMAFDLSDGLVARLIRQTSRFGGQLDSLCDAVSFGLAPAFLVLKSTYFYHHRFLWGICVLYVVCVLIRLARYNSEMGEENPNHFFSGLPSPAAAGMIASFAVTTPRLTKMAEVSTSEWARQLGHWLGVITDISLPVMTVVVALLMVSRVRYPHFNQYLKGRGQLHHLVQIVFAIVAACAVHELALPLIFLAFVIGSPIRAAWTRTVVREPSPGAARRPGRRLADWRFRRVPPRRVPARSWRAKPPRAQPPVPRTRIKENTMTPPKTLAHESKTYHEFANWYERVFERFFGPRIEATIRSLAIPPGSRVLEVGVGTGLSLAAYPQHAHVTAIDLSPAMLAHAQQKIDQHGWKHIELQAMNALELNYLDESFDYVTTFHVVSVVPDYAQMMQEMIRVCKTHGTLVIINHFRSPRAWVAVPVDLLDPVTRRLGWRTTLSTADLLDGQPLEVLRNDKTSWRSLFRVIVARKTPQVLER